MTFSFSLLRRLLLATSEGVYHLGMDNCSPIRCRLMAEGIESSRGFRLFASATRGTCTRRETLEDSAGAMVAGSPRNQPSLLRITAEGIVDSKGKIFEVFCHQAMLSKHLTPLGMHHTMSRWNGRIMTHHSTPSSCSDIDHCIVDRLNAHMNTLQSDDAKEKCLRNPLATAQAVLLLLSSSEMSDGLRIPSLPDDDVLDSLSLLDIQQRVALLIHLNQCLFQTFLPYVDITTTDCVSFGAMIRLHKGYLFTHLKKEYMLQTLAQTSSNNSKNSNPGYQSSSKGLPAQIRLDNFLASSSRERSETSIFTSKNCFVQAFQQLHQKDSKIYRFIFSTDRVFHIQFEKESGIDAGGVFREGVTRIIEDLFLVREFDLLVLCPNVSVHAFMLLLNSCSILYSFHCNVDGQVLAQHALILPPIGSADAGVCGETPRHVSPGQANSTLFLSLTGVEVSHFRGPSC